MDEEKWWVLFQSSLCKVCKSVVLLLFCKTYKHLWKENTLIQLYIKNAFCRYILDKMEEFHFLLDWTKSQNRSSGWSLHKLQIEAKHPTIMWTLPSSAMCMLFESNIQHPHFYTICIILSGLRPANKAVFVNNAYFWIGISFSSSKCRQEPIVKVVTLQILQTD